MAPWPAPHGRPGFIQSRLRCLGPAPFAISGRCDAPAIRQRLRCAAADFGGGPGEVYPVETEPLDYLCISMDYLWISLDSLWIIYGYLWISLDSLWIIYGYLWISKGKANFRTELNDSFVKWCTPRPSNLSVLFLGQTSMVSR